jgi:hypothetical protein
MPNIYFPVINNSERVFTYPLGAQIEGDFSNCEQWKIPKRTYKYTIKWKDIESNPDIYVWPNKPLTTNNIINIKGTPKWARILPDFSGSPPKPEYYVQLRKFINLLAKRYSPIAIELFNEPDVKVTDINSELSEYFGAWVLPGESFYQGGVRYGNFCNKIYSKEYGSKLLAGALMMHENSLEFLHGMIAAKFKADFLSYHCYISSKKDFNRIFDLAIILEGLAKLPVVVTETSLLGDIDTPTLQEDQKNYLKYILKNLFYSNLQLVVWYTLANNGWKNSDLVYNNISKPVYEVWKSDLSINNL